ncbi:RNA-binding protein NOB1-like [Tropilaelaps mercedesae]|uniref:RNA-binding protein NOB1 n=1 Tax=Tropilaelaps mercedesae TaxID=418985 RepID=A0A1V9XZQ0_9ACAR|nr:RNA-binding protein NOB1-like [Tropilaelaps mercedesae]
MATERRTRVEHLVVDANAFIRNVNLFELGENIYTLPNVVSEIRDYATRQRLQLLPYELKFRVPSTESIKAVTDFSKKTGDYPTLSSVDLSIIGLTHFLEKEIMGNVNHLNTEPKCNRPLINPKRGEVTFVGGMKIPVLDEALGPASDEAWNMDDLPAVVDDDRDEGHETEEEMDSSDVLKKIENVHITERAEGEDRPLTSADPNAEPINYVDENENGEDSNENDNSGWITTDNIQQVKCSMGLGGLSASKNVEMPRVACITADFAMQNVLIQMGLHCLSMNGVCIRHARTYILRCFACFKRTSDMTRLFCPSCGNKGTLKKVAIELDENGELKMFINYKKPINKRGLRYTLPVFKGGKHSNNPILNEYQPRPQNKLPKKALIKVSALDPDYAAQNSPFSKNDVQSRAAMLDVRHIGGLRPGLDRDPYMNRVRTGNKKRKNRLH